MNNIIPFNYDGENVRVVMDESGNPWWVAKDVCNILEMANPRKAISGLEADEKGVTKSDTLGGPQNVTTINEPGLYTLIIRSNKPEAKPFKRWITHEVLPSIRKTGRYEIPEAPRLDAMTVLKKHPGLKKTQRIRLLELSYRMANMGAEARGEVFVQYNALCEAFAGKSSNSRTADVRLVDTYLRALMDEGPVNRGFESGTDAEDNPYFLATTGQLVDALKTLGRERGLPPLSHSAVQFGTRFVRNRAELLRLGWVRSDRPGKIINGDRYFRYTLVEVPEG